MAGFDSYDVIKPPGDASKTLRIAKFLTPTLPELSAQAVLRPPTAKPRAKPKPYLKPKQRKKWYDEQREKQLKEGEGNSQWKIEDPKNKKSYSGNAEQKRDRAQYALLVQRGSRWSLHPYLEFYNFQPDVAYQTLTLEEAEVKMKSKTNDGRWIMRKKMHARVLDKMQDETKTNPEDENPLNLENEEIDEEKLPAIEGETQADRRKKLKQKKREDQQIDYKEKFDDDEGEKIGEVHSEQEESEEEEGKPQAAGKEGKEYKRLKDLTDKEISAKAESDESDISDLSGDDLSDESEETGDEGEKKPKKEKKTKKDKENGGRDKDSGPPPEAASPTRQKGKGKKRSKEQTEPKGRKKAKKASKQSSLSSIPERRLTAEDVKRELQQPKRFTTNALLASLRNKNFILDKETTKTDLLPLLKTLCVLVTDPVTKEKYLQLKP